MSEYVCDNKSNLPEVEDKLWELKEVIEKNCPNSTSNEVKQEVFRLLTNDYIIDVCNPSTPPKETLGDALLSACSASNNSEITIDDFYSELAEEEFHISAPEQTMFLFPLGP